MPEQLYNLTEVAGEYNQPVDDWISKNKHHADQYFDATGREILFCKDGSWYGNHFFYTAMQYDFDVHFRVKVIRAIIEKMMNE